MATQQEILRSVANILEIEVCHIRISKRHLRSEAEEIDQLSSSISDYGLLHPLIVRRSDSSDEFEVISGIRRLQALQQMGAQYATCRIVEASDRRAFEIALSENLQRKQLSPVEEALAFQHYVKVCKWGRVKNLAKKIGKSEEYVNHRLKLLELPTGVLSMIGKELSASQAEELSWIGDPEAQSRLAKIAVEKKLTVKQLHQLALLEKNDCDPNLKHGNVIQPTKDDYSWLPKKIKDESSVHNPARIFKSNVVALRYLLAYFDDRIAEMQEAGSMEDSVNFMVRQRYLLHQILDNFIKAICLNDTSVHVDAALANSKKRGAIGSN